MPPAATAARNSKDLHRGLVMAASGESVYHLAPVSQTRAYPHRGFWHPAVRAALDWAPARGGKAGSPTPAGASCSNVGQPETRVAPKHLNQQELATRPLLRAHLLRYLGHPTVGGV